MEKRRAEETYDKRDEGTTMDNQEFAPILAAILDVGELMLTSGAEVNRVEKTIQRMGKAYGCSKVDVFTITSSIVVTVKTQEGQILTQTRRIYEYATNMGRVENCNRLAGKICEKPLDVEMLQEEIQKIREDVGYPGWMNLLCYPVIAASFTVFFGGSGLDFVSSAICSILLYGATRLCGFLKLQRIIMTLVCSMITCGGTVALKKLGVVDSIDMVIIGNVMLLIPGIALTTSLRDMISGDMISGLLGLCEALIRALAIAAGFALVLLVFPV